MKKLLVTVSVFAVCTSGALRILATPAPSGSASLTIDADFDANNLIAPCPVITTARPTGFAVDELIITDASESAIPTNSTTATTDPSLHQIEYFWKLTRPAGAASTFSTETLNIPTAWNDRNIAYGKNAAWAFDEPGDYTIECWAIDQQGNTATATYTFETGGDAGPIVDRSTLRIVAVGPTVGNNLANSGADPSLRFTDWSSARDEYISNNYADDTIVLFEEDATYDISAGFWSDLNKRTGGIRFGSYPSSGGAGAKPVLELADTLKIFFTVGTDSQKFTSVIVDNLVFKRSFNPQTERGVSGPAISMLTASCYFLSHKCDYEGVEVGPTLWRENNHVGGPNSNAVEGCQILSEAKLSWQNYGMFLEDGNTLNNRVGIIGCDFYRGDGYMSGNRGFQGADSGGDALGQCSHGPWRNEATDVVIYACSFASISSHLSGYQPILRLRTKPYVELGGGLLGDRPATAFAPHIVARCVFENGNIACGSNTSGYSTEVGHPEAPGNFLIYGNLFVASGIDGPLVTIDAGGTTVRGNIFVYPANADNSATAISKTQDALNNGDESDHNHSQPVVIEGNTLLCLRTSAQNDNGPARIYNPSDIYLGRFTDFTVTNNVVHAPNLDTAITGDGPFTLSQIAGFTPRFVGQRWGFLYRLETVTSLLPGDTISVAYADLPMTTPGGTSSSYNGGTMDNVYWTTTYPGDDQHTIICRGKQNAIFYAERGDISVDFSNSTNAVITMLTACMSGKPSPDIAVGETITFAGGGTATVDVAPFAAPTGGPEWRMIVSGISGTINAGTFTASGGGTQTLVDPAALYDTVWRINLDRTSINPPQQTIYQVSPTANVIATPDAGAGAETLDTTPLDMVFNFNGELIDTTPPAGSGLTNQSTPRKGAI